MSPSQTKHNTKPNAVSASLSRSNSIVSGSLFSTKANSEAKILPLDRIIANKQQPRRTFDEQKLEELADDIKKHGVLQPPIVRPLANEQDTSEDETGGNAAKVNQGNKGTRYQLVVGERRYRAALLAGLKEIPVIIREYSDQEVGAISLVENLQREDLDIEDEALYFKRLSEEYNLSTRQIGKLISKNHLYVYKRLKLLERPDLLEQVRASELNLNRALEIIREDDDIANQVDISKSVNGGNKVEEENRFPGKQSTGEMMTSNKTWKKFYQFTKYLKLSVPKIDVTNPADKEELKTTIGEIEEQLTELKKRLEKS